MTHKPIIVMKPAAAADEGIWGVCSGEGGTLICFWIEGQPPEPASVHKLTVIPKDEDDD